MSKNTKITRSFEYDKDGKNISIQATYEESIWQKVLDADGWQIPTDETVMTRNINIDLVATANGKEYKFDVRLTPDRPYFEIDKRNGAKVFPYYPNGIHFVDDDIPNKISEFLTELVAEGTTEEAKKIIEVQKKKDLAKKIEEAKRAIEIGRSQAFLPTEAEAKAMRKQYNDIHNEGGDGYVPSYVTAERFQCASDFLKENGIEPKPFRDDSEPVNEITLTSHDGTTVHFTEDGWEVIKIGNRASHGYLQVDDDSPDHITNDLKKILVEFWGREPDGMPGLGATPQTKYGLNCSEYAKENKIYLA